MTHTEDTWEMFDKKLFQIMAKYIYLSPQLAQKGVEVLGEPLHKAILKEVRSQKAVWERAERERIKEAWRKFRSEGDGINTFLDKLWEALQ